MPVFRIDVERYKPGQVIKVYSLLSHISPFPIWHYGVVVGHDDVVHFNLVAEDVEFRIIRTNLKKFVHGGSRLQVCQMSELNTKYDKEIVVERALSQVGLDFGGYNLVTNNCEHFANWCVSGDNYSNQVPWTEGDEHPLIVKAIEKVVAEPILRATDNIAYATEKIVEKAEEFCDWIDDI